MRERRRRARRKGENKDNYKFVDDITVEDRKEKQQG